MSLSLSYNGRCTSADKITARFYQACNEVHVHWGGVLFVKKIKHRIYGDLTGQQTWQELPFSLLILIKNACMKECRFSFQREKHKMFTDLSDLSIRFLFFFSC